MDNVIKTVTVAVASILAPIHAVMATVGVLIVVDLITGMWAAYKRGERITSAGIRRTVTKMLLFQIAVISGFSVEHFIIDKALPISKIVAGAIAFSELTSVLENVAFITGKDIFKDLIKKLGSKNDKKE